MEFDSDRVPTFFRFEDLRIYNKALEYIEWVYSMIGAIPEESSAELGSKFVLSAQNIAMNIAEGSSRNKSQFVYYLKMAKSCVRECVVYTSLCKRMGYFSDDSVEASRNNLMEMTKMLGALIGSLQKSTGGAPDDND